MTKSLEHCHGFSRLYSIKLAEARLTDVCVHVLPLLCACVAVFVPPCVAAVETGAVMNKMAHNLIYAKSDFPSSSRMSVLDSALILMSLNVCCN